MSRFCLSLALTLVVFAAPARSEDTPKAAKTRELLKKKISVDFKDTRLRDAMEEIKEQVPGLKIILDTRGGVSMNTTINYSGKDKSVEQILDEMFKKNGLGYVVISKKADAYDGLVKIKQGSERGYEKGQEPAK